MLRGGHKEFIDFMNSLLLLDDEFVSNLVLTRFRCNDDILDHPTVQAVGPEDGDVGRAGFLGVMNGFFGTLENGNGPITIVVDEGKILKFRETQSGSR